MFNRKSLLAALVAPLALIGEFAHADTTAFTTAVSTASTDIATYGAALVGVAAIGVGFMVGMKYVKKISRAA